VLDQITPLILAFNEAPNIRRTLDKLLWARRIVVIDSGSTDETVEIVQCYSQAELVKHEFVDFASQCNFGLTQICTPWVLSLDADYELSDALVREIQSLVSTDQVAGYRARFVYRIHGRALRGTLYPPRIVLYRKQQAVYQQEGHGHRVVITGEVQTLRGAISHDDRKPLARWIGSQLRYARDEAEHLLTTPRETLTRADRIRLMGWPAPIATFLYTLFVKGCVLDGWAGWYYALQRGTAEALLALELVERRLGTRARAAGRATPYEIDHDD